MISSRFAAQCVAATALLCGVVGAAESQTANTARPKTTAEIARDIAFTYTNSASALNAPSAPVTFVSATSRDNIVEVRYVAKDNAVFARLKNNSDQMRLSKTSYYCHESRVAYLKKGVVIHEVVATSDNSDQFDFTFDKSSCDSLPNVKVADSNTLAELATTVAKAENETLGQSSDSPYRLNGATAHQGIVDLRFIVLDASAKASTQANRGNITGVLTGYTCSKYRTFIFQGLVFHHFFVLQDGSPVIDFTIDRSNC